MEEGDALGRRNPLGQPGDHRLDARQAVILRRLPALAPALELPPDIALGMAEIVESGRRRVGHVQGGERVHQHLADAPREGGIVLDHRRRLGANDDAAAPLHDMELGADERGVAAIEIAARCKGEDIGQRREHAVLPLHVMGRGRDGPKRGAAQHVFVIAEGDEIGEIGMAAAELAQAEGALRPRQMRAQIGLDPRRLDLLARPRIDQLGRSPRHRRLTRPRRGPPPPCRRRCTW